MGGDETAAVAAPTRRRLAESIRDRISTGVLEPGSRLNERELCEDFDVSRTVVRETLRQIEAEGFVTIEPNRGAVVVTVSYADAEQMFELRESLESLACSLFARRGTLEHKQRLWAVIERLEAAVDGGDLTEIIAAKDEFYDVLMLGAGNDQLTSTLRLLRVRINLLRRYSLALPERHPETLAEIRAIRDAVVSGDVDGARRAGEHHVRQASRSALPRIFAEMQPSP
ncbi:GntR family transcriptional regulator [Gordonia sp. HY002]|uniref:GntR family transcriptional regulator n=1 Tax=Gordonia zhenghanii TaxID=2911516 RepID=UPI001EF0D94C|nr:GntR family transcriptional regulator [Gordonia zhenghanii]MCF8569072.1 GntR family transcriptional regulator [Gordonia zhenghanii]MCF8605218.1 GntR family transcriptional regulator [Gordonia zhenghanii]